MNTNAKINFYLKEKSSKNKSGIFANVMINNIRVKKAIPKFRVEPKYWDDKKQRLKATFPDHLKKAVINGELERLNKVLEEKFESYQIQIKDKDLLNSLVTSCIYLKDAIPLEIKNNPGFFEYYQKYLDVSSNELSTGFIKQQKVTMGKLMMFEQHIGKKLQFEGFTVDLFDDFFAFLLSSGSEKDGKKIGIHNNSTINGHIKRIKIFLSASKTKKWHNTVEYRDYKRKRQATEDEAAIISLTWEEVLKLYTFQFATEHLRKVRDVFCFSCVLGLRYSDYSALNKKEFKTVIVIDSKGKEKPMIETFIIKNRKRVPVRLPYSIYAQEIVKKYEDTFSPYLLPVLSSQTMNTSIKEICRIAGFNEPTKVVYYRGGKEIKETREKWELMCTHSGRKNFISKCVENGVPLHVIASFTGHSKNSKSLARYYNISDRMKVDFFPEDLYNKKTA